MFKGSGDTPTNNTHDNKRSKEAAKAKVINDRVSENAWKGQNSCSTVECKRPPEPCGLVAQVLVYNMPAYVLALTRAIIRTEATNALPSGSAAAEAAGPATTRDSSLL
mmetsp:Transcript_30146/g.61188  ORF Transcript_30146/g.61188 Transcript_30146/m.61188 type:complete len:108 (-) Transcript_30146:1132-1455(-)